MSTKTLIIKMTSATTCEVENVIALVPGTPFEPPAGRVLLTVARTVFVGIGFVGTLQEDGSWTFAAPAPDEAPPEELTVQDRIAQAEAKFAEGLAEITALKGQLG